MHKVGKWADDERLCWGCAWVAKESAGGVGRVSFLFLTNPEEWLLHLSSFGGCLAASESRGGSQSPRAIVHFLVIPAPTTSHRAATSGAAFKAFVFCLEGWCLFWHRAWHPLSVSGTTLTEGMESVGLGSWGFIEFALKSYWVVLAEAAFLMNPPDWWSHVFAKNRRGRSTEWSGFLFNLAVLLSSTLTCPMFSPHHLLVLTSH